MARLGGPGDLRVHGRSLPRKRASRRLDRLACLTTCFGLLAGAVALGRLAGPSPIGLAVAPAAAASLASAGVVIAAADTTPPVVTTPVLSTSLALSGAPVRVTASATDGGGVAAIEIRVDASAWTAVSATDATWGGAAESSVSLVNGYATAVAPGRRTGAGDSHTCALTGGAVVCWGSNVYGQASGRSGPDDTVGTVVPDITSATAIATGTNHSCALLQDGTLRCWGSNQYGQLGRASGDPAPLPVSGITTATAIATGFAHTCALLLGGTVSCWGVNGHGQLGSASPATLPSTSVPTIVPDITTATAIAAGEEHTCVLLASGAVRCWGWNLYGQLGDGSKVDRSAPVTSLNVTGATALSGGYGHTCVIAGLYIRCWGYNAFGQLGDGTTTDRTTAVQAVITLPPIRLAAGDVHTCAAFDTAGFSVRCWGRNANGQLGDGTKTDSTGGVTVAGLTNPLWLGSGTGSSCAVRTDRTVACWGWNANGQLGDGTRTDRTTGVTALAIRPPLDDAVHQVCARATDLSGNVSAVSCAPLTVRVPPSANLLRPASLTNAASIAYSVAFTKPVTDVTAGDFTTSGTATGCAVAAPTGSASSYGVTVTGCSQGTVTLTLRANSVSDANGTPGPSTDRSAASVIIDRVAPSIRVPALSAPAPQLGVPVQVSTSAGDDLGLGSIELAIDASAWTTLVQVPSNQTSTGVEATSTLNLDITSVAAGEDHSCALLRGGSVRCWGRNAFGELGNGTFADSSTGVAVADLTTATAVFAGGLGGGFSCALLSDATLRCWGRGITGGLGDGSWRDSSTGVRVLDISTATTAALGGGFACARLANGTVRCWGNNPYGQLGDGTKTGKSAPVTVIGVAGATAIAAGATHACAVVGGGGVQCWGQNTYGQLGNGTTVDSSTAVSVVGIGPAIAVAAGNGHSCALLATGAAACWGRNGSGQLGNGGSLDSSTGVAVTDLTGGTAIAAGNLTSCVRRGDGTLACWGSAGYGQIGDGTATTRRTPVAVTGLPPVSAVSVSFYHACAQLTDGGVRCWGNDAYGQLGNGVNGAFTTRAPILAAWPPLAAGVHQVCVRATDAAGNVSATSPCVSLSIGGPPAVTQHPAHRSASSGSIASFTAVASGLPIPTVRWQVSTNGTTWTTASGSSATTGTYSLTATTGDNGKRFRAVFTNALGSATSGEAILNVLSVTSFTPTSGGPGTAVTLTGTGFTGVTAVAFNGAGGPINAPFTVASATTIYTSVPTGTTTGAIRVTNSATAASTSFTAKTTLTVPSITSFSPTSGAVGSIVTVTGLNLAGVTAATIGGISVSTITITGPGSLTLRVPAGAVTGLIGLTSAGGTRATTTNFTVLLAAYTLTVAKGGETTGTAGTVTSNPAGISCGATCASSFSTGTTVVLTAATSGDGAFTGWSGGCTGTATTCSVTIGGNVTVTATFKLRTSAAYISPASATKSTSFVLVGTLTGPGGSALAGLTGVTFSVGGKTYTANWDAATQRYLAAATAPKSVGLYTVTIAYAGNTTYAASSGTGSLQVN